MKILIIGGSGGIGHALVASCIHDYPDATILATYHRHPGNLNHPRLQWLTLDVTNEQSIQKLSQDCGPLDILINAVGFLHEGKQRPEKTIDAFSVEFFTRNIQLNTLPSILIAKHFMGHLKADHSTCYAVFSARIGSISENHLGGWISYRSAKAALNMAIRTISLEWRRRSPNCCILLFHPGTTDTPLSKPFQKNLPNIQLQSPEFTADCLLHLIEKATPKDSGKFFSFDGAELPW